MAQCILEFEVDGGEATTHPAFAGSWSVVYLALADGHGGPQTSCHLIKALQQAAERELLPAVERIARTAIGASLDSKDSKDSKKTKKKLELPRILGPQLSHELHQHFQEVLARPLPITDESGSTLVASLVLCAPQHSGLLGSIVTYLQLGDSHGAVIDAFTGKARHGELLHVQDHSRDPLLSRMKDVTYKSSAWYRGEVWVVDEIRRALGPSESKYEEVHLQSHAEGKATKVVLSSKEVVVLRSASRPMSECDWWILDIIPSSNDDKEGPVPVVAEPQKFGDEWEVARYNLWLETRAPPGCIPSLHQVSKKFAMQCEGRVTSQVQFPGPSWKRKNYLELPEPPRLVSHAALLEAWPPEMCSSFRRLCQSKPSITAFWLPPTEHPWVVALACDGVDSKLAVSDWRHALVDPWNCEKNHPTLFSLGLKELVEKQRAKSQGDACKTATTATTATRSKETKGGRTRRKLWSAPVPHTEEWAADPSGYSSAGLLELVEGDRLWYEAVRHSSRRLADLRADPPPNSTVMVESPETAAEALCHLAVCHGSDDNVSVLGVLYP